MIGVRGGDAVVEASSQDRRSARDDLVSRAQSGDVDALALIGADLDAHPATLALIVRFAGAEEGLISSIAGGDALRIEALRRRAASIRADLAGAEASPLELLLTERIAVTWLAVLEAELSALPVSGRSLKLAEYYERRLDRAQRRHLAAIKALAVVRRLGLPIVQLNVAREQVNIGQVEAGDARFGRSARAP